MSGEEEDAIETKTSAHFHLPVGCFALRKCRPGAPGRRGSRPLRLCRRAQAGQRHDTFTIRNTTFSRPSKLHDRLVDWEYWNMR